MTDFPRILTLAAIVLAACAVVSPATAQTAENVAVVINDNSPVSRKIGEYYAQKRALPEKNVLRIRTEIGENISRAAYASSIEAPLAALLRRDGLLDRVLYIVLTKGVPLRITGTSGLEGTVSSVDSELTLLYRRMTGENVTVIGRIDNPYFVGARNLADLKPFTHRDFDIFLVTRLDAFTVDEAIGLIDRAAAPVDEGRVVLDQQQDSQSNRSGEEWLEDAAMRLTEQGFGARVLLEKSAQVARDQSPVLGYYSWGSNDPRNRVRKVNLGFVPGSIAAMFMSSDARTFREPPARWIPQDTADQSKWFAGSSQSLIGDLIREGVTGVAGHVAEPYLQSTIRPNILFPAYVSGLNLAQAFYAAMPYLSWQTVVIGDPLCSPFARTTLARADIEAGEDATTLLPQFFSKRRLATAIAEGRGIPEKALALSLRADVLLLREDRAQAQIALEQATEEAPQWVLGHTQLALLYDAVERYDLSEDRYRRILALTPRSPIALNNLAYSLSVRRQKLEEALPLAQQAVALAPQNPVMLDTLAWIEHLMGDDASAVQRIALAVRDAPDVAEMRLHAAVIFAATGSRGPAARELAEALKLQPDLETSEQVKQVRERLEQLAKP